MGGHHRISLSCLEEYLAELGLPAVKIMIIEDDKKSRVDQD
jgi:hypothetical protein